MVDSINKPGRLRPAPENFLSEEQIKAVGAGRRDFLRKSFLAAGAALAAPIAARASEGDPAILNLPEWTTTLGQAVAVRPYGLPSKFEANVIMVQTTYRGASPEEVQNTLTKPIEDAVSAIEGVDQITSTSMEGVSAITITLKQGTSVNDAQRDAGAAGRSDSSDDDVVDADFEEVKDDDKKN